MREIKKLYELKKWFPVFVINMVAGVFAYSLLIIHQLVNQYDGMWHGSVSYANGHELSNGRWFWRFLDRGRNFLSPDPVTSVIALCFFILAFILILDIFDVRSRAVSILASLLFTVNISVLVSLSYRYMSPTFAYCLASARELPPNFTTFFIVIPLCFYSENRLLSAIRQQL